MTILLFIPEFELDFLPNSIAIACYSLTMYREEEEITKLADALVQDFDRVLFNIHFRDRNVMRFWRNSRLKEFEIYPIGPQGSLFATKKPEDIRRLKEFYPFDDGRFLTGIDDAMDHYFCRTPSEPYRFYADWKDESITHEDELPVKTNEQREKEAADICQREIAHLGLAITLLSAEYDADRLTMVLKFKAEDHEDLRELAKALVSVLHMKVEMKQEK